ncbi:methyltransferase domain protein [Burkholderia thailandensis MSMB121]|nr:methyltransferase domain protein [Burkholderia thailandensis MSMB121]ATF37320.1 class I SAM-dependent methyltransferase [Burkholderia thailandensis]
MKICNMDMLERKEYRSWKEKSSRIQYLTKCLDHYYSTPLNSTISPYETMVDQWYMDVGCSAADVIIQSLHNSWTGRIERVLDIPCGHGRVLRHLVNLFPDAEIYASDIDRSGVDFCRDTLGAIGIYSNEDMTAVDFDTTFDLIWVGSLFTHTSRTVTRKWLEHLAKFLTENGIIVATVHGRWCETVAKKSPYINVESWKKILREYQETGYGYHDYNPSENHDYISGSYGVSLTTASEILKDIESVKGIRIFSYRERGWADHQDVLVVGRPAYDHSW